MNKATVTLLAHTLKGSGLSCLFVMLALPQAIGPKDLSAITGYDRKSVTKGLDKLAALGLAENHGRYNSWSLTVQGYQLALFNPRNPDLALNGKNNGSEGEKLPLEGENFPLPLRSSSSYLNTESLNTESLKQLLPTPSDAEKLPLPPEAGRLTEILICRCGCPTKRARQAVKAALASDDAPIVIEIDILRWLAYCQSERGQSIQNPGVFIASKIEKAEPCPEYFKVEPGSELDLEITDLEYKLRPKEEFVCLR